MRAAFIVNAGAGRLVGHASRARAGEIIGACRERGIEATVELCDPGRVTALARKLAVDGVDAVVAVGGDGTVSAVAAGIAGTDVPLGVLPLGTLNHFSKDVGITDLAGAFEAIAARRTVRVDVGEVNGRVFVNNSSIGVYPEFIALRDRERRHTGVRRWFAALLSAARRLLTRYELEVCIAVPGHVTVAHTPFVLIGNNAYTRDLLALGTRRRLDAGRLSVYTMHARSRVQMLRALVQALVWNQNPPELEEHEVERVVISTAKRSLKVALDGEVVRMRSPLEYRIRPLALVVLAPANPARGMEIGRRAHLGSP